MSMQSNCSILFHTMGSLPLFFVLVGFFCFFHFFTSLSKNKIQNNNLKCKSFDMLESKAPEVPFLQGYIAFLKMWQYNLFQTLKKEDISEDRILPSASTPTSWSLPQAYSRTVTSSVTVLWSRSCQREEDSYSRSSRIHSPALEYMVKQIKSLSSQTPLTEVLARPQIVWRRSYGTHKISTELILFTEVFVKSQWG